jgi:hypothetical protein
MKKGNIGDVVDDIYKLLLYPERRQGRMGKKEGGVKSREL